MKPVPHGEPYAGKLHVRFDEGAGVPDNKGRPALLYSVPYDTRNGVCPRIGSGHGVPMPGLRLISSSSTAHLQLIYSSSPAHLSFTPLW